MTWSILARDAETGLFGLAVASRFFAVGAVCPWSAPHGIAMTQAEVSPALGHRALGLLAEGVPADDAIALLAGMDAAHPVRQVHVMDRDGHAAQHTGRDCVDWCGGLASRDISVAGNMLAGPDVVQASFDAWQAGAGQPIVERLLGAMHAGEAAGGDKRGRQSAALRIQGPEIGPRLDIRADDHPDPLAELERLYSVARERFLPWAAGMPRAGRPYGIRDRAVVDALIERDGGTALVADPALPEP